MTNIAMNKGAMKRKVRMSPKRGDLPKKFEYEGNDSVFLEYIHDDLTLIGGYNLYMEIGQQHFILFHSC
jgi:hypothetical protein